MNVVVFLSFASSTDNIGDFVVLSTGPCGQHVGMGTKLAQRFVEFKKKIIQDLVSK